MHAVCNIPLCAPGMPPGKPPQSADDGIAAGPQDAYPRILIVEDEFFVAWHVEGVLRDLGVTVCEIASNMETALDRAVGFEAELLLMDVNLGGGPDGIEVLRKLREYSDAPAIFITAYSDSTTLGRIEKAEPGAPVLSKPVSPAALRAAIERVMPNRLK